MWRGRRGFLLPYRFGCLYEPALARSRFCARNGFDLSIRRKEQQRVLDAILHFFHSLYDADGLKELIRSGGAPLICAIVFVETGFFVGFFLPGDSLLVTAGIFAAAGHLDLAWLLILVPLCAIVGDQVGYWIGRRAGQALYRRQDSLLFKKRHLEHAHRFYERHGGKTIILARFVPIIRTFCRLVAGAERMTDRQYLTCDAFGGLFWVGSTVLGGRFLGRPVGE